MIDNIFEYFGCSSGLYSTLNKYNFHLDWVAIDKYITGMYWKALLKQYVGIEFIVFFFFMNQEQKQTFIWNVMKLIIGVVLLFISYGYLQNHPAEKVSVLSWFEIMYQRWQIWVYDIVGKDVVGLKQKFRLIQYYQELIRTAENKKCSDVSLLKELHESYIDIRALSYDELAASLPELSARADEINVKIFAQCSGS